MKTNIDKVKSLKLAVLYFLFCVVIAAGVFLRFYQIGKESLWFDEIFAMQIASRNFWDVVLGRVADPGNPPLFYAILNLWGRFFGWTEFAVRIPAVLFSLTTLPFIFLCASAISRNKLFPFYSTTLFSVSLFSILWSQEARAYSLFVLLVTISLWLQSLVIFNKERKKEPRLMIIYFIITLFGLYTHYLYFYILFIQGIIWTIFVFIQKKKHLTLYLFLGFFSFFIFFWIFWGSSHLIPAIFSENRGYNIYERSGYEFHSLGESRFSLESFYFFVFNGIHSLLFHRMDAFLNFVFSLIIILPVLLLFFLSHDKKREKKVLIFLSLPLLFTLFLAVFTFFGQLVYNHYYYIFLIPYIYLLVGYLFSMFPIKNFGLLVFSTFIVVSLFSDYIYLKTPHKTQFREAAEYLLDKTNPESRTYVPEKDVHYVLNYYFILRDRELYVNNSLSETSTKFFVKKSQNDAELDLNNFEKTYFLNLEVYEKKQ